MKSEYKTRKRVTFVIYCSYETYLFIDQLFDSREVLSDTGGEPKAWSSTSTSTAQRNKDNINGRRQERLQAETKASDTENS